MIKKITVYAAYEKTLYREDTTGYKIIKVKLTDPSKDILDAFDNHLTISAKGYISDSLFVYPLKFVGTISGNKYGKTLDFCSVEPTSDQRDKAIEFLSSNHFYGVSKKIAESILDTVGEDIFDFPLKQTKEESIEILCSIKGIGKKVAENIVNVLFDSQLSKTIFDYIANYGGKFANSEKLLKLYGKNAIEELNKNPYKIGPEIGLSFLSCDRIARDNGIQYNDTERLQYLIKRAFIEDWVNGNSHPDNNTIISYVNDYSAKRSAFPDKCFEEKDIIGRCYCTPGITVDYADTPDSDYTDEDSCCDKFYLNASYENQLNIVSDVRRIQRKRNSVYRKYININKVIAECEEELKIKYSEQQKECFNFLSSTGIKILTGGPGTGKSTVINGLIHAYQTLNPYSKIALMAPTGRAAQRMREITGLKAGTIHKTLKIKPYETNDFIFEASYIHDFPAGLIIIDEASMLDEQLAAVMLSCFKEDSTVILVGDIDQLPSVGAGKVLEDLLKCKVDDEPIERVNLIVNYRQKGKATIIKNANLINSGDGNIETDESFIYNVVNTDEELKECAVNAFLLCYDSDNPFSVQILCPKNKGIAGVKELNTELQNSINGDKSNILSGKDYKFKIGDKVMATVNNYESEYVNGDIGIIKSCNSKSFTVDFSGRSVKVDKAQKDDFQLAYATTIHKSQGSQYDTVIICLPKDSDGMMYRNLLYTAITRAQKQVFLYSAEGNVEKAAERTISDRISDLDEMFNKKSL